MPRWQDAPAVEQQPSSNRWSQAPAVEQSNQLRTLGDYATGIGDLAVSSLRGMVNQPAVTLGALVEGGLNPNDTYLNARERLQGDIAQGRGLVGDASLRTPQGQQMGRVLGQAAGEVMQHFGVPQALEWVGDKIERVAGPTGRAIAGDVTQSAATLAGLKAAPKATTAGARLVADELRAVKPLTVEDVIARQTNRSVGAAEVPFDASGATPELRAGLAPRKADRPDDFYREAAQRHLDADSLPVPVKLTEGMATQAPSLITRDQNARGRLAEVGRRINESNAALGQNLQHLRERLGENVFSTNATEHGDTLISAYRELDDTYRRNIDQAYAALRNAVGGDTTPIVDAKAILENVKAKLEVAMASDDAPKGVMAALERLSGSGMSYEQFENLRKNLARIQRESSDGSTRYAAGLIRDAAEELPLTGDAARFKGLADQARALAKQRFDAIDADPAYKAAIAESVPPDKFVSKFVLSGARDNVDTMLRHIPQARNTLGVAVLDHLTRAAHVGEGQTGNFAAAGYNNALRGLEAKMRVVFDADTADTLEKLGRVAGYVTKIPAGSAVNTSNTLTGALVPGMLETAISGFVTGIPAPTLTAARQGWRYLGDRSLENQILRPGAGVYLPAAQRPIRPKTRAELLAEQLIRQPNKEGNP